MRVAGMLNVFPHDSALSTRFTSEKQEALGQYLPRGPVTPLSKNSVENFSCTCFVWGQRPVGKSQLSL